MKRKIAKLTNKRIFQVERVLELIEEGYTIPFIARYRKEMTNNLNETDIKNILEVYEHIKKLNTRRYEIIEILKERGQLDNKLIQNLNHAQNLTRLEEVYAPFKRKQKTKAMIAKELGLEDVAKQLFIFKERRENDFDFRISENLPTSKDVLINSLYIIIENIVNNDYIRKAIKELYYKYGVLVVSKIDKYNIDPDGVFKNYYEFLKPIRFMESFQILAINRGVNDGILDLKFDSNTDFPYKIERILKIETDLAYYPELKKAINKAFISHLKPSICREILGELKNKAEKRAIDVFANNLKHLMLKKPFKANVVLGIDPGYRTGCKIAVVDKNGKFLENCVIYPTPPYNEVEESAGVVLRLIDRYNIDVIAIGDGTASYETSLFISSIIQENNLDTKFTMVSESGASVYSASQVAIDEFPTLDITVRSAISIARRVLSTLDEFIKIPPESIGVGMYQHDINPKKLSNSLNFVVDSIVHYVGVDINKASSILLEHISGISKSVANNIVKYREEMGEFESREELLKVRGFGVKAFELASGFCRVSTSKNPLDNTIIHPNDYKKVEILLASMGTTKTVNDFSYQELKTFFSEFMRAQLVCHELTKEQIDFIYEAIVERDIDPREALPDIRLSTRVPAINDFVPGCEYEGEIKNMTDFGLFINLGLKFNGLLHVSNFSSKDEMFDKYYPGKSIKVIVTRVDERKNRIDLSL